MEAAKKGIFNKGNENIAERWSYGWKILMQRVASGEVAIPANKNHSSLMAKGVGTGPIYKDKCKFRISKVALM